MKGTISGRAAALAAITAVMALGGCGSKQEAAPAPSEAASPADNAKAEAAKLERPEPGLYKQTSEITKFEMPGMPADQASVMKGMMKKGQSITFCLTKEQSEQGYRDMFDKVREGGQCDYSNFKVSGGTIDAVMECKNPEGGTSSVHIAGSIGSSGSDVTADIEQKNPDSPMGNTRIGMHMKTERIGDCAG